MLQNVSNLLGTFEVLSKTLGHAEDVRIADVEKKALLQTSHLARSGIEAIALSQATLERLNPAGNTRDPLLIAEVRAIDALLAEVLLTEGLVSDIARRDRNKPEEERFGSLYVSLKLGRITGKVRRIFTGLDCQHRGRIEDCPQRKNCLIAAWKEVQEGEPRHE